MNGYSSEAMAFDWCPLSVICHLSVSSLTHVTRIAPASLVAIKKALNQPSAHLPFFFPEFFWVRNFDGKISGKNWNQDFHLVYFRFYSKQCMVQSHMNYSYLHSHDKIKITYFYYTLRPFLNRLIDFSASVRLKNTVVPWIGQWIALLSHDLKIIFEN